jgi:hypothetical protein
MVCRACRKGPCPEPCRRAQQKLRDLDQSIREERGAVRVYGRRRRRSGLLVYSHLRGDELHHIRELQRQRRRMLA